MVTLSHPPPSHFHLQVNFNGELQLRKDATNSFSYTARSTFQKIRAYFLNEQGPTQGAGLI